MKHNETYACESQTVTGCVGCDRQGPADLLLNLNRPGRSLLHCTAMMRFPKILLGVTLFPCLLSGSIRVTGVGLSIYSTPLPHFGRDNMILLNALFPGAPPIFFSPGRRILLAATASVHFCVQRYSAWTGARKLSKRRASLMLWPRFALKML